MTENIVENESLVEDWTLESLWNESLDAAPEWTYEARKRLWASELYKSDVDLFLLLNGTQPTNPPDYRAKRKMETGKMVERNITSVMRRCGILKSTQDRIVFDQEGLLPVTGKLDFLAGGQVNEEQITLMLQEMEEDDAFGRRLVSNIREKFAGRVLKQKVIELKSLSLHAFNKVLATGKPLRGHGVQAYHYSRNGKVEAAIAYVCRDDSRMYWIPIPTYDETLEKIYIDKIRRVTEAIESGIQPEIAPLVLYDEELGKFETNFQVQYSAYLTMLYGFQHPEEYGGPKGTVSKKVKSWNSVLKRIRDGKDMTKNNLEKIKEMGEFGFDTPKIFEHQLAIKDSLKEEDDEEETYE